MSEYRRMEAVRQAMKVLNRTDRLVVFDTETTGLKPDSRIVQFSAVEYKIEKKDGNLQLQKERTVNLYIKQPDYVIFDKRAMEVNKITPDFLNDKPYAEEVIQTIDELMDGNVAWTGYNIEKFDVPKLAFLYDCLDVAYPVNLQKENTDRNVFDVYLMAKELIPAEEIENRNLENVCSYYGLGSDAKFHDAIEDTEATAGVLQKMLMDIKNTEPSHAKIHGAVEILRMSPFSKSKNLRRVYIEYKFRGKYGKLYFDAVDNKYVQDGNDIDEMDMEKFNVAAEQKSHELFGKGLTQAANIKKKSAA